MLETCPTCKKTRRALLYCRKNDCGFLASSSIAAVDLPRPQVDVVPNPDGSKEHVVIHRDGKAKSYEIEGSTTSEKIKNTVTKVINDRYTGEWLP